MPDLKISQLPAASTPLAGTELVPVVQGGITEQTPVQSLLTSTVPSGTANGVMYLNGSKVATTGGALTFDGSNLGIGTTSPSARLNVAIDGAGQATPAALFFSNNDGFSPQSLAGLAIYSNRTSGFIDTNLVYGNTVNSYLAFGNHNGTSYSERMRLDTSGNLMVGGTGETYRINSIKNTGTSGLETNFIATNQTDSNFAISVSGSAASDKRARIGTVSNTALTFATADTERMRLDTSGNLGLGVTPSGWGGSYVASLQMRLGGGIANNNPNDVHVFNNCYHNGTNWLYTATNSASRFEQFNGGHYWFTAPSGTAGNAISFTQAMTLDASGNLLVGATANPGVLNKSVVVNSGADSLAGLVLQNNATGSGSTDGSHITLAGTELRIANAENAPTTFFNNGSERARITSGGELLVGQVGTGPLNINGVAIGPANTGGIDYNHLNGTASGIMYARFNLNATTIGSITQSGTTAVLYNTTSDARLKTNIVDAPEASELIDSIKVRSFDWISDNSHQRYGMVAQELAQVAPEAVHQPANPDEMMAVDYSKLVPMLIKEIQSLRARVAVLESN